ncbi:hypothetical protein ACEPPN_016365 [Leptodophora sp. 'Broadleaf-Isolate-01']
MVAIQSILSILAMTAIANALQSELVARGEVVSNYRFFNGKGCNFAESPSRRLSLFSVPRPATLRSHKTRDRSASATPRRTLRALASTKVVIGEQHTAGCTGKPIVTKSSSNPQCLNVNGTAPQNFYKFTCGN